MKRMIWWARIKTDGQSKRGLMNFDGVSNMELRHGRMDKKGSLSIRLCTARRKRTAPLKGASLCRGHMIEKHHRQHTYIVTV